MTPRHFATMIGATLLQLVATAAFAVAPNVLIIMADDCTFNDLPVYGGQNAKTPNIDKLAAEGMVFNHAYLSEAMCQPCRAELYSGRFPMSNGCAWNHSASHPSVTSMPQHLRRHGYRVGIAGKVHVKPTKAFPFDQVGGFDASCVRDPTRQHDLARVRKYMRGKEPFCLVVALVEPHVPWVMGDKSKYPPATIRLPANIADTELTREAFGRYLAEISYMDSQVGELLESLELSGHANDTLVLFTSEQGSQFPGCKWTNWDTGLHTAFIARWPGVIQPGTRTDAMIQYADVLPTLIDLTNNDAQVAEPDHKDFDGKSFASVLKGDAKAHREYAFGIHNNVPEGPSYPIRTVTNGKHRYIRNLLPNELYIERHLMGLKGTGRLNNPYWNTWIWSASDDPTTYNLVKRYTIRPKEELYNTAKDPFELKNLADAPAAAGIQAQLADRLDAWMQQQSDPGIAVDTVPALRAARSGMHLHGRAAQPSGAANP